MDVCMHQFGLYWSLSGAVDCSVDPAGYIHLAVVTGRIFNVSSGVSLCFRGRRRQLNSILDS